MKPIELVEDAGWVLVMGLTVPVVILIIGSTIALSGRFVLWLIALL